jgi:hypothetical protein
MRLIRPLRGIFRHFNSPSIVPLMTAVAVSRAIGLFDSCAETLSAGRAPVSNRDRTPAPQPFRGKLQATSASPLSFAAFEIHRASTKPELCPLNRTAQVPLFPDRHHFNGCTNAFSSHPYRSSVSREMDLPVRIKN